jgi:hypothetical protein
MFASVRRCLMKIASRVAKLPPIVDHNVIKCGSDPFPKGQSVRVGGLVMRTAISNAGIAMSFALASWLRHQGLSNFTAGHLQHVSCLTRT